MNSLINYVMLVLLWAWAGLMVAGLGYTVFMSVADPSFTILTLIYLGILALNIYLLRKIHREIKQEKLLKKPAEGTRQGAHDDLP